MRPSSELASLDMEGRINRSISGGKSTDSSVKMLLNFSITNPLISFLFVHQVPSSSLITSIAFLLCQIIVDK